MSALCCVADTDPFTLVIAPGTNNSAAGALFLDEYDGYQVEVSLTMRFEFNEGVLRSRILKRGGAGVPPAATSQIERIRFLGQSAPPRGVLVRRATGEVVEGVAMLYEPSTSTLIVRKPNVGVGEEWTVELL